MTSPKAFADQGDKPQTRTDVLLIDGMFCAACAASVEAAIRRHPGVDEVNVNFAAEAAVIERAAGRAGGDLPALIERIASLGYRARSSALAEGGERSREHDPIARDLSLRLIIAVFFGMWVMLPSVGLYLDAGAGQPVTQWRLALAAGVLCLPVVLWSGLPFYRMAWRTLRAGTPGIDALVTIGTVGALLLSVISLSRGSAAVYFEVAVALIALQLLARLIDLRVRRRAREAISALVALTPTRLRRLRNGEERDVALKEIKIGDRLRVLAGERLAVDGVVHEGLASVDRSLLSGESEAVTVQAGAALHAGERLVDGAVTLEVMAGAGRRRLDALAKQVRQMLASKAPWQRAVDRLARYFLWLSLALGAVAGVAVFAVGGEPQAAALRALAVFVIACPCALSLAAPLAGLCASQAASRQGIILRDLNAITSAATPTHVFLDKTGTLTRGMPSVRALHPRKSVDGDELLRRAGEAERLSTHPLAQGIVEAARTRGLLGPTPSAGARVSVVPGKGLRYRSDDGQETCLGSTTWFEQLGLVTADIAPPLAGPATRVWVAHGGQVLGAIDLIDDLRGGVDEALVALREEGVQLGILSGDSAEPVAYLAQTLGIDGRFGLSPEAKVEAIEAVRAQHPGAVVAFVGDGLNDSPALAAADLGVAVGEATDAARAAAAVTLTDGGVERMPGLLRLVRRLRAVVRRNLAWAIAYNVLALPAAAAGWVHPAVAASAMALSSISIIASAASAGR
ncbi:MAG: cation-translocating P-type ATPase [Pseudomonadota bacterium]